MLNTSAPWILDPETKVVLLFVVVDLIKTGKQGRTHKEGKDNKFTKEVVIEEGKILTG